MGGVKATMDELRTIMRLKDNGDSFVDIARKIGRSSTFVQNKYHAMVAGEITVPPVTRAEITLPRQTEPETPTLTRAQTIDQILSLSLDKAIKMQVIEALI